MYALAVGLVFVFVVLAAALVAGLSFRIVSPYEKGVVERLGRYSHTAQPGLHFIIPFVDRMRKVDMREQVVDVQPQEVITKDNVVVTVDAIVYYEATDPVKLTYNVADFYWAATKLAQTNLRNVIGETELDEALTSREMINVKLRTVLDEATDKWGTRVVRVEIKRIDPPADVTAAMHRQMKAERENRAQILESEGLRQAVSWRPKGCARRASWRRRARPRPCARSPTPPAFAWRRRRPARPRPSKASMGPFTRRIPTSASSRFSILIR